MIRGRNELTYVVKGLPSMSHTEHTGSESVMCCTQYQQCTCVSILLNALGCSAELKSRQGHMALYSSSTLAMTQIYYHKSFAPLIINPQSDNQNSNPGLVQNSSSISGESIVQIIGQVTIHFICVLDVPSIHYLIKSQQTQQ